MNSPTPPPQAKGPNQAPAEQEPWTDGRPFRRQLSDTGGPDEFEITGTAAFLIRSGVNVGMSSSRRTYEERITVRGDDGQDWEVWGEEWFGMRARRPRTHAERVQWLDDFNSRISTEFFSKDRQVMCFHIAAEIAGLADLVAGDRPTTRAARRHLRKQLAAFSAVQMRLTARHKVDMAEMRAKLAAAGLVLEQPDFHAGFETAVH